MYKRILVPLDGSEQAEAVLPQACSLAETTRAEIVLLRVVGARTRSPIFIPPQVAGDRVDTLRLLTLGYLQRIAEKMRARHLKVTTEVSSGRAADTILRCAQELQADIIVMSTHGDCGPTPWLMDNTTQEITRRATVPVLLVGGGSANSRGVNSPLRARLTG